MKVFYVSSYGKHHDKGIYIMKFNEETLEMKRVQQIETQDFPSYMICNNHTLYVAYKNASSHSNGGGLGSFSIYKDELLLNNNYHSSGRSYTHLCVDQNNRYLFAANYHVGATASYQLENSIITQKICAVHHVGLGPDLLKRQTGPHAHYVGITPDQEFVYSVDLGSDKVVMYRYSQGVLLEDPDYTLNIVPGSGPRHMIFSKDGRFAYLVNEIANNIMVFKYYQGHFQLIQAIHCIPRHFNGFSSAAAIHLTKSGHHLFVSNRGHDSIAMYRVNQESGKISLLYMVHTGKEPRDFQILDDKYLIIACQGSNLLQVMTFNEETEELILTDSTIEIPAPVCIAFESHKEKFMFYDVSDLKNDEIYLKLVETCEAIPEKRWFPAYRFEICLHNGTVIGHCDLRIGHNELTYIGGNIGYDIDESYRGHRYAAKACQLLFQLAKKHQLQYVIITCAPENIASSRTCEIAGGEFVELADIPPTHDMYQEGKRQVKIYKFVL